MISWTGSARRMEIGGKRLSGAPLCWTLACLMSAIGCFSRSPVFDSALSEEYRRKAETLVLEGARERWRFRRSARKNKRPDYRNGYYLHLGGWTTCSGWWRKKQTTHVYTWVTERSPMGTQVKPKHLTAGFDYRSGFFKGAGVSKGVAHQFESEAHDTITGFDDDSICQCVNAFGAAVVHGRLFLRTSEKLCPDL